MNYSRSVIIKDKLLLKTSPLYSERGDKTKLSRIRFPKEVFSVYIVILVIGNFLLRIGTAPTFIESRDGIFFVRGIQHYSVLELRPQWPGYPVYIWLGNLVYVVTNNPTLALHILSIVASSICILPISALAGGWLYSSNRNYKQAQFGGFAAGFIWALLPLSWLGGSEIFSDPLALLLGFTMLWACWQALTKQETARNPGLYLVLAGLLGGFMIGVRLSYITLLLPLLYISWLTRKTKVKVKGNLALPILPLVALFSLALPVILWLGWQIKAEGTHFFEAANTHLAGHYEEWGGSVTTDSNLLSRPLRFFETNLVYGWGGWFPSTPLIRISVTISLTALLISGGYRLFKSPKRIALFLALLWAVPYALWILIGNDVDLARYDFPLIAMTCIVAGMGLPQGRLKSQLALIMVLISLCIVTVPLAVEHHVSPPIGQRLAAYSNTNLNPAKSAVIITDDVPTLVFFMSEIAPSYRTLRFSNDQIAIQTWRLESQGKTVYATLNPANATTDWEPVARFCRGRFMESRGPIETWLYRHKPDAVSKSKQSASPPDVGLQCS